MSTGSAGSVESGEVVLPAAPRKRKRRFGPWRRSVQAAVASLYLALPFANAAGWRGLSGTLASLKVGPVDLSEPAAALSAALATRSVPAVLLLGVLPALLLSLALGGVFCSWICPFGLLSEGGAYAAAALRRRRGRVLPGGALLAPDRNARRIRTRLGTLAGLLVLSLLLGAPLAALLSPPRLVTALPLEAALLGVWPAVTGALLLVLLAVEALRPRWICTALCPAGTVATLVRFPGALTVGWTEERCSCPPAARCQAVCPWGIDPRTMHLADGCTNCLACVDGCPTGALRLASRVLRPARPGAGGPLPG